MRYSGNTYLKRDMKYNPQKIEKKWQKRWEEDGTFKDYSRKEKFYALDMFPYPSGAGLHVGHPKGYIATDVVARFEQLRGKSVLHPMGWDAFGLPAENYALKNKVHPRISTEENIKTFKEQLGKIGFTYDWDREINTTDPEYYKWTQWIFLQMFRKGLAYESNEPINWCPSCKTGLANEDLEDGKCERCGSEVEQKPMRQWVLKMTEYADRLLEDLDKEDLDWEQQIKEQQRNWIGRSEGVKIEFRIKNLEFGISVFTTRIDTIFGCTYVVLAPEHKEISNLKSQISNWDKVEKYVEQAKKKTNLQRTELAKEKTGVKLEGVEAINPFNGESVPVFVADYVLGSYGTGAVMAVPAHDERDLEFAKKYELPIRVVVKSADDYKEIDTKKLISLAKTIFTKAQEEEFFAILVGGVAHSLQEDGALGKHSDIDVFVDKKGFGMLENYFLENGYNSATRDDKTDFHEWNDHKWFWKKGEWIDLFVVKEKNGILFDEVGSEKNIWGPIQDVVVHKSIDDVVVSVPTQLVAENIDFALSHSWNYCFTDRGILTRSGKYTGMDSYDAKKKMIEWLEKTGNGKRQVNYKMRDWVFSRQRYWGEPIPIVHCKKCGPVAVPEQDLPVRLPEVESYEPTGTGESPLAGITAWVNTKCPKCGGPGKRETNTMPQWAGSSWYYLRYIDPKNTKELVEKKKEEKWMPVDLYVGGAEHATRHLLYARFWHKFLYDIGVVSTKEPFRRLVHVGLISAEDGRKMSKRWNNVINPDDVIAEFGADSLRLYEMFMGPFTQNIAWSTDGVSGVRRFLDKVWRFLESHQKYGREYMQEWVKEYEKGKIYKDGNGEERGMGDTSNDEKYRIKTNLHKTIKKVTEDIEAFRFNTAVAQMMTFLNSFYKVYEYDHAEGGAQITMEQNGFLRGCDFKKFLILLSPFAPHIAEELWEKLGNKKSIFFEKWPVWDENLVQDETIMLVVQVNGKVRDKMEVLADISEEDAKKKALASERVQKFIDGKEVRKIIFVSGKLVNIVV